MEVDLTQCNEPEEESQQEQSEEEKTQQPFPPWATGVGAAAQSSTSKDATVPVNLYRRSKD